MWHKAPCSSRDYSGVRESGPRKRDEDGDDDGDVDEDDGNWMWKMGDIYCMVFKLC